MNFLQKSVNYRFITYSDSMAVTFVGSQPGGDSHTVSHCFSFI